MSKKKTELKNILLNHMKNKKKEHPRKKEILAAIKKKIKKSGKSYHTYDCKSKRLRPSIDYKNSRILIICKDCNGQASF